MAPDLSRAGAARDRVYPVVVGITATEAQALVDAGVADRATTTEVETAVEEVAMPDGSTAGDMLVWDGAAWVALPVGTEGQVLTISSGVPAWVTPA